MLSVERTFVVPAPVVAVFDYLSDFTTTEHWDPGTVTTTRTDDGPLGVGATFHNVSKFRGRQTELDYELVTYEPSRHVVFVGNNKTVTSKDDLTTSGDETSTTIHYVASFEFHGIARLAEPFLKRGLETLADETIAQMTSTLSALG